MVSALDLSARAIASNDTAIASDHWKTLQVTGATTITLSSAASMGAGYEVGVFNAGASTVTVAPGVGSDTINNVSASVTIPIKGTMIFRTNQALTGYNVVGQSNRQDAGTINGATIDNSIIGGTTPLAGSFTTLSATGGLTPTFTSSETAVGGTSATTTIAHGLGAVPRLVSLVIRCKTAEFGYSINDEVQVLSGAVGSASVSGQIIYADSTNVGLVQGTAQISIIRRDTFAITTITAASWKYVARAWK